MQTHGVDKDRYNMESTEQLDEHDSNRQSPGAHDVHVADSVANVRHEIDGVAELSHHTGSILTPTDDIALIPRHSSQVAGHSKRLSLQVPIGIPSFSRGVHTRPTQREPSPGMTATSTSSTPQIDDVHSDSSVPPSSIFATPLTPASESSEDVLARPIRSTRNVNTRRTHARSHTLAHTACAPTPPLRTTSPSESTAPPDFLTLLASQERRVLELREELHRAETELTALKKQWAVHEANKKKGELRNGGVVKMDLMGSPAAGKERQDRHLNNVAGRGHGRSATMITAASGLGLSLQPEEGEADTGQQLKKWEVDRDHHKALMQERLRRRGTTLESGPQQSPVLGRRSSQRVFSGSRHTRALSLLTTATVPRPVIHGSTDGDTLREAAAEHATAVETPSQTNPTDAGRDHSADSFPSLARTGSNFTREINLGKTYKDLASAASKRSLPQSADALMKQGKVVVDGVRDGLWNFFEDIRQATVGDEAARELDSDPDRVGESQRKMGGLTPKRSSKTAAIKAKRSKEELTVSEQSFWREFGIDSPKSERKKHAASGNGGITKSKPAPGLKNSPLRRTNGPDKNSQNARSESVTTEIEGAHAAEAGNVIRAANSPQPIPDPNTPRATTNRKAVLIPDSTPVQKQDSKKDHHHSHWSTDSGDSRDSRNPPSLMSDSPTTTTITDGDEDDQNLDDGEGDSWDWKEADSPMRKRKVANDLAIDPDTTAQGNENRARWTGQAADRGKEYDWHALTR